RRATERDAAPDNIRIAAHPLAPEVFSHHRHVSGFFFVRQKGAAPDRTDAKHIEIVRRHLPAEDLHRIAESGERERGRILRRGAMPSTSKSTLCNARERAIAAIAPIVDPIKSNCIPCESTSMRIWLGRAPSARRMPISRTRLTVV